MEGVSPLCAKQEPRWLQRIITIMQTSLHTVKMSVLSREEMQCHQILERSEDIFATCEMKNVTMQLISVNNKYKNTGAKREKEKTGMKRRT